MDKILHSLPRIIQPEGDECDHCMEDLVRCNYFVNGGDIQSHLSLVESSLKLWQAYKAAYKRKCSHSKQEKGNSILQKTEMN